MISVIMPAYNVANYIEKSINSVLQQSYTDFELVIVNDGSTDNTREIILDCQAKDNRIRLVEQTNQGVSVARNTGIENAQGEYISFLDGDDLWHQDFFAGNGKFCRKFRSKYRVRICQNIGMF